MDSIEIIPGVRISNDRCLILDDGPTVVIGDLHLGYETALENEGMYIPRINTESICENLNKILLRYEPKRVVLLGDVKHDFSRTPFECRREIARIIKVLESSSEVIVIKGNHDNFIQNILSEMNLTAVDYTDIMGFRLEHGHVDSCRRPVIIAHEHPSVRIAGSVSGGVKFHCFLHEKESGIIVIPPFSLFSSGNDLTPADPSVFMSDACKGADMAKATVYGVTEIGLMKIGSLESVKEIEV